MCACSGCGAAHTVEQQRARDREAAPLIVWSEACVTVEAAEDGSAADGWCVGQDDPPRAPRTPGGARRMPRGARATCPSPGSVGEPFLPLRCGVAYLRGPRTTPSSGRRARAREAEAEGPIGTSSVRHRELERRECECVDVDAEGAEESGRPVIKLSSRSHKRDARGPMRR
ncbi:hypothetical protein OH77DRAFT_1416083 [Trametes cingulata]|nr:hypothetical protein OH77DRAFT_1416083 [Trametes cingulata]